MDSLPENDDLCGPSNAELDDALTERCAHMNAAEHLLVRPVGERAARGLRGEYGVKSVAQWLSFECGIDLGAARETVRVARALRELPLIRACYRVIT